jgi:PAS domain S-box-containing protein
MGLFSHKDSGGKAAEAVSSLHNEKQKSDVIVNSIDDAVIMVDETNVIHVFNPAATLLTGWAGGEVESLDYRSILKFVDDKGAMKGDETHPFFQVLGSGRPFRDDAGNLQTKDGKVLSVDISVTPLLDKDKKVNGAVAILRNVHAQRQQEKQRADFISTASHEMRTPVAAIEGYLALALNEKVAKIDANARSYLEKAHSSTQHLGKLFQDLLTSARAEDGRLTSHPVVVEMSDFVEKLVEDLKFSAEKKGLLLELLMGAQHRSAAGSSIDVTQKVIKPLLYASVDPDRIREVITNLFDNAVKYTESGRISIGITGDSEVVQFHIADTGPGIPKEDIPHLFQKFYRVDNSATRTIGGTGLGLFISRKIVELYNGRIWVESEVDKGSKFFINLPRINGEKAQRMIKEQARVSTGI